MTQKLPLKIATAYALVGAVWILLSDRLLHMLVHDTPLLSRLSILKGWIFVLVTSLVLYRLISRSQAASEALHASLREREELLQNVRREATAGISIDITGHKLTEEALRRTNETIESLISASPLAIVTLDAAANVRIWNRAAERLFGWNAREVEGKPLPIIPETEKKSFKRHSDSDLAGEELDAVELRRIRKDGTMVDIKLWTSSIKDAGGCIIGLIGMYTDITAQKEADSRILAYQEQLRFLASEISLVEERERRQIATALHDQIGQTLALARIKVGMLKETEASEKCRLAANEIGRLLEQAIRASRSLTFELSPPILYEIGFEAAVQSLCEKFQEEHGIRVKFTTDGEPKALGDDLRVFLFQAVRELLVNVVKHAGAQTICVSSRRKDQTVRVAVEDDGVGFDAATATSHPRDGHGFGLFSTRERLVYLGGIFDLESVPGRGTRVTISAPLAEPQQEREDER